jgi:hypothetical protein
MLLKFQKYGLNGLLFFLLLWFWLQRLSSLLHGNAARVNFHILLTKVSPSGISPLGLFWRHDTGISIVIECNALLAFFVLITSLACSHSVTMLSFLVQKGGANRSLLLDLIPRDK